MPTTPAITNVLLIDATADKAVRELVDGDILPTGNWSFEARGTAIKSVKFGWNENRSYKVVDGAGPYYIDGHDGRGNIYGTKLATVGHHVLTVTGYSEPGARGVESCTRVYRIKVIDQVSSTPPPVPAVSYTVGKGQSIQAAVDKAKPGDEITIADGVYPESVTVRVSGTPDKPITIRGQSEAGVILDGGLTLPFALDLSKARHVAVERLTARRYFSGYSPQDSTIRLGSDCTLLDVTSRENVGGGIGIPAGTDRPTFLRTKAIDNGLDGFHGSRFTNARFEDTRSTGNGWGHALNADRAKAEPNRYRQTNGKWHKNTDVECEKFAYVDGVTMVRHVASGNNTLDLWYDLDCRNVTLIDCWIGWYAFEVSPGPLNIMGGRGAVGIWESGQWSDDGGKTWHTTRWSIAGHRFDVLDPKGWSLELRQGKRSQAQSSYVARVGGKTIWCRFGPGDVTDNEFVGVPLHTDGEIFTTTGPVAMGMVIDRNTYRPATTGNNKGVCVFWGRWADGRWDLDECRRRGIELQGRVVSGNK